jgi:MFS family permease
MQYPEPLAPRGGVMRDAASNQRTCLRWLFMIQLVSMGAMEMSAPFWPLHLAALGQLSGPGLAFASSAAYAGPMLMAIGFTPWWGRLGDRLGHKPMLLRALLALAATQLWIACADDTLSILLARLVQGALGGFIAAAQAYGAGLVRGEQRASLMANLQVATAIGAMLGPLAGGWWFGSVGFAALNLVAALTCLCCALLAWRVLPATSSANAHLSPDQAALQTAPAPTPRPFSFAAVQGLLLAIVLVQTGKMMPQTFFGLFAQQVLHSSPWLIGLCHGAPALGLCLAAPFWGKRFDAQPGAAVLTQVEWICWACAAIVAIQASSTNIVCFVLARVLWGVALAALLPVFYGLLSSQTASCHQGQVLGLGNSAAKVGALLGAAAGGLVLAWLPIRYAFWPVVALYGLSAIVMRLLRKQSVAALHSAAI